jgi:autotransporter-associated beta strand protein
MAVFLFAINLSASAADVTWSGTVVFSTNTVITDNVTLAGDVTLQCDGIVNIPNNVSGSGKLIKTGSSTLILSDKNKSFSGAIEVKKGTLQTSVNVNTSGIKVERGARVYFLTRINELTCTYPISGEGEVRKIGSKHLKLFGANTWTGETYIDGGDGDAGELWFNGNLASSKITVESGCGLVFEGNGSNSSYVVNGNITGGGNLVVMTNRTLMLKGTNNNYTGTTRTHGNGYLEVGNGGIQKTSGIS